MANDYWGDVPEPRIWHCGKSRYVPLTPKLVAFFKEIDDVCQKHGLGIAHEDGHGAFEVVDYARGTFDSQANLDTSE